MDVQHNSLKRRTVISTVTPDGAVIDTVLRRGGGTALVMARDGSIEVRPELPIGEVVYVPIAATNNLVKHKVMLLPAEPAEYDDLETLLHDIRLYVRRYVSLSEQALSLAIAYVLLTWVYDAFNELPYLRFRGDYGTGKTRALLVIGSLCYKAFFASGASTVSPIFHTLDSFKGTLIFDEADFRFTDEKAELVKILNNGNAKGFPVLRTQVTPKKEFNPRAFMIFGPKIVGMRRSYADRALESRFLTIDMEPGHADGVPINLPDEQKAEALTLRNKLLMYRLRHRLLVRLDSSLADPALEPRLNQILLPLLTILPSDEIRQGVRAHAVALQSAVIADRAASAEADILTALVRLLGDEMNKIVSLSEIAAAVTAQFAGEFERPVTNRWIGSILRRMRIVLYKRNGVFVVMPGQRALIDILRTRYGVESDTRTDTDSSAVRELGR